MQITFQFCFLNWSVVASVLLASTVQQSESAICMCVFSLFRISLHLSHQRVLSSLCNTVGSHQASVLYIEVYICQSPSLNSSHPTFPPQCPYICSLHLCLFLHFEQVHLYHFSRFHIYVLRNICLNFTLQSSIKLEIDTGHT